jgi:hypothetical protein
MNSILEPVPSGGASRFDEALRAARLRPRRAADKVIARGKGPFSTERT